MIIRQCGTWASGGFARARYRGAAPVSNSNQMKITNVQWGGPSGRLVKLFCSGGKKLNIPEEGASSGNRSKLNVVHAKVHTDFCVLRRQTGKAESWRRLLLAMLLRGAITQYGAAAWLLQVSQHDTLYAEFKRKQRFRYLTQYLLRMLPPHIPSMFKSLIFKKRVA